MSLQKEYTNITANAWAKPLSLVHRRISEKVTTVQDSSKETDTGPVMKHAKMRIDKNQEVEAQADNLLQLPEKIDVEAVAYKVYRLMQADLILEKERISRPGG